MLAMTVEPGRVTVDGDSRQVDTSGLITQDVALISYDEQRQRAWLEYTEDTQVEIEERDLHAEDLRNADLRMRHLPESDEPIFRRRRVRKPGRWLEDAAVLQQLYQRWADAAPPAPPPEDPVETQRVTDIEQDIKNTSLGAVEPKTLAQLAQLTRAEFRAWFDTNFTTEAQRARLLRWILMFLVRRFFG